MSPVMLYIFILVAMWMESRDKRSLGCHAGGLSCNPGQGQLGFLGAVAVRRKSLVEGTLPNFVTGGEEERKGAN